MVATNDPLFARYALPGVPTPLLDDDVANKAYVDGLAGGTGIVSESLEIDADGQIVTVATQASNLHIVADSDGGVGNDNLDNLLAAGSVSFAAGTILVIQSLDSVRDITVRASEPGAGLFRMLGNADFILTSNQDSITFMSNGTNWLELSRSDNG